MKVKLSPFYRQKDHQVTVDFLRNNKTLELTYNITGELSWISLPKFRQEGERKNRLWESTCFELFLGIEGKDEYLEFNVAPNGDWNIYHFDGIRIGMKEDAQAKLTLFPPLQEGKRYQQKIEIDLENSSFAEASLTMGITAITHFDEQFEFWALLHPDPERPDFHHPEGHILSC